MDEDFQGKSDIFIRWLTHDSSASISQKVALSDMRGHGAGRGVAENMDLVALDDIEEDEELFEVPRSSIISVENSDLNKRIPEAFEELDPWIALILVMIYEYLKGSESRWKSYFDILPLHFDSLMFWSDEELAELQGSAVLHKIGKNEADEIFKMQILRVIQARPEVFVVSSSMPPCEHPLSDSTILALAHRMGSLIMAYAFDIGKDRRDLEEDDEGFVSEDEEEALPKGMIPLADMLNADADRNNARLFHGPSSLSMKALKPIRKGEEIFNDYGSLPRSDLLRRYGYITDNYGQYDVVELPTAAISDTAAETLVLDPEDQQSRLDYLEERGVLEEGYDVSHATASSAFPPELLVLAHILLLPPNEFRALSARGSLPKAQITSDILKLLRQVLERRRSAYTTTIEEDKTLLRNIFISSRKRMAIKVRLGEKEVLQEALVEIQDLAKHINGDGDGDGKDFGRKRIAEETTKDGPKKQKTG
ncbi:MAG: hypothetical protein M1827_000583 [Pycnora praestabilis]|nr:MAG: hypothetical protein M1827_000583 [Pycnora praestabilis]